MLQFRRLAVKIVEGGNVAMRNGFESIRDLAIRNALGLVDPMEI